MVQYSLRRVTVAVVPVKLYFYTVFFTSILCICSYDVHIVIHVDVHMKRLFLHFGRRRRPPAAAAIPPTESRRCATSARQARPPFGLQRAHFPAISDPRSPSHPLHPSKPPLSATNRVWARPTLSAISTRCPSAPPACNTSVRQLPYTTRRSDRITPLLTQLHWWSGSSWS